MNTHYPGQKGNSKNGVSALTDFEVSSVKQGHERRAFPCLINKDHLAEVKINKENSNMTSDVAVQDRCIKKTGHFQQCHEKNQIH